MGLFPRTYFPRHADNRMRSEGDLVQSRKAFLTNQSNNLSFLLRKRYEWMHQFIKEGDVIVEIGAGAGFSKYFIKYPLVSTEIDAYPWIDVCADALRLPFGSETIDIVICVNALHHFATPIKFLWDIQRCLRSRGYALIFEPNPSAFLKLALRIMRHEGWSLEVNVFDPKLQVNDPADPWSGNNAISSLLFDDKEYFETRLDGFKIVYDKFLEAIIFPLSGGVTAKSRTIDLPVSVLSVIGWIDEGLCRSFPSVFAMGRAVALQKR